MICGGSKDYARFFIIPGWYRTHLPEELKSHRSHDIVLMCFACHESASQHQEKLKQELAKKHDAPMTEFLPNKVRNIHIAAISKAANSLLKAAAKMPEERRESLRQTIMSTLSANRDMFLDCVPLPLLEQACQNNFSDELLNFSQAFQPLKLTNKDKHNPHGIKIV